MKKLFGFLIGFLITCTVFVPADAWAGCVSFLRWAHPECDEMTEANAKELARLALINPSILRTGTGSIQGLAHYNDPPMAGCRNCQEGANMINEAYYNAFRQSCHNSYTEAEDIKSCMDKYSKDQGYQNNIRESGRQRGRAAQNNRASIYCIGAHAIANVVQGAGGDGNKVLDAIAKSGSSTYNTISKAFYSFHNGCWFCPIFDTIYDVSNDLATRLYNDLRQYFLSFLMIFAFGWILFHALKFFVTLHAPNVGEFFTTIFKTLGAVMLAAAFLTPDVTFLTGHLIEIPADFAIEISDTILAAAGFCRDGKATKTNYSVDRKGDCPDDVDVTSTQEEVELCQASDPNKYKDKAMSQAMHDNFSCLIKKVSFELVDYIAIAATMIVESFSSGWLGLPSLSLLIIGVLMMLCYFYFYIRIPFYLIDLILRLVFLVIMLPIFVVCYPFPSTRGYSKKGWEMLLSILVHMIALCIFIVLALQLVLSVFNVQISSC